VSALPICTTADEFERWLQGAAPDARCVYATGATLPRFAACALLARGWADAGLVGLVQQRQHDGSWHFIAYRKVTQHRSAMRTPSAATNAYDESPKQTVLRLIRRAANLGLPCPTLGKLAIEAGFADDDAGRKRVQRIIADLEGTAEIRVQTTNDGKRRITITSGEKSGRSTGWLDMRAGAAKWVK